MTMRIVLWDWPGCTVALRVGSTAAHQVFPLRENDGWWRCQTCWVTFPGGPGPTGTLCPNDWRRRR